MQKKQVFPIEGCKICGALSIPCAEVDAPWKVLGNAKLRYYKCENCGASFTDAFDRFTSEQIKQLYRYPDYFEVDRWAKLESEGIGPGRAQILLDSLWVGEKSLGRPATSVLVAGNGSSKFPHLLKHIRPDIRTIDFSDIADTPNRSYDIILSAELFEHFVEPRKEFAKLLSLLAPDGVAVGTVRHQNIWHRFGCDLEEDWPHLMV